jgi:uncharacterized Zn finger protein
MEVNRMEGAPTLTRGQQLHLEGHVRIVRNNEDGTVVAMVRSGTHPVLTYRVEATPGDWTCACQHGQHHQDCGHRCSHIEAVAIATKLSDER